MILQPRRLLHATRIPHSQYGSDAMCVLLGVVNVAEKIAFGKGDRQEVDNTVPSEVSEAQSSVPTPTAISTPSATPSSTSVEVLEAERVEATEIHEPSAPAHMQQTQVPATRLSRLFQYGALAVGVGAGVVGAAVQRSFSPVSTSADSNTSLVFSPTNVERIVNRLSRMRGAALKLGQMLSIQDSHLLPKEFEQILLRVQNSANYMPDSQLMKMMDKELGPGWQTTKFESFNQTPFAAASIGQVHYATLPPTSDSALSIPVAVKIQYPGVAQSIDSDISYLRTLSLMGSILPRGMYLDNTLRVAKLELGWECDYKREADAMIQFRDLLIKNRLKGVNVPRVFEHVSTPRVLIGNRMLELCLKQLFSFRFMQTDPNWSNFLYDEKTDTIQMLDFGAAREFPSSFTDTYLKLLKAASIKDRNASIKYSQDLGFLTGYESEAMLNAHLNSLFLLSSPFSPSQTTPFDFGAQSITSSVRADIPTMLKERLTPPPDESYSLHRSLSGSFLLCAKLGARVDCARLFASIAQV
ncbi:UNVERIFIED_CONTAM: hypothetical protein HDU68_007574 [Siphonaria sp. JEL0065]|nr:hypothetical protein HDU68_007574 [Siphonaria sp. JEL0065]